MSGLEYDCECGFEITGVIGDPYEKPTLYCPECGGELPGTVSQNTP